MSLIRIILYSLLLVAPVAAETIRVGAAISLKESITEIAADYEAKTADKIEFVFGSSGQIMAQIRNGAQIDVFIGAANKQVDDLEKEKLVDAESRRIIVANALVLIAPADDKEAPASFAALDQPHIKRIAIGEPKTVPAGQYAEQVLASLKLADAVRGKLVFGTNVRQVLTYVERGEVSAGLVYATDAKEAGDKVIVIATADPKTHEPIVYPGVLVTASQKQQAGNRFLTHLQQKAAQDVFKARGFIVDETKPK